MQWIVLSYTLPTQKRSSLRVTLWRRLRRLGTLPLAGGLQVLPARAECSEALQWLAQEIRQADGEALVLRVDQLHDISDQQIIRWFHAARQADYEALAADVMTLESLLSQSLLPAERRHRQQTLTKLQARYTEIAHIDYFHCPAGTQVATQLAQIGQTLSQLEQPADPGVTATLSAYCDTHWVTRPQPHVDRLACIWFIRRFINPAAVIRYANTVAADETPFDMSEGIFSHHGNLCTFETMVHAFTLAEPGLQAIGELVHALDLRDGRFLRPEAAGVDAVLSGWLLAGLSDQALEMHGVQLFEGLYLAYQFPQPVLEETDKSKGAP